MNYKESDLTPWFTDQDPEHVGVYEVDDGEMQFYTWHAYWDGKRFGYRTNQGAESASVCQNKRTGQPPKTKWRGLAVKPVDNPPERWILMTTKHPLALAILKTETVFLQNARPRSTTWGGPKQALSFTTKEKAEQFLQRSYVIRLVDELGLQAVNAADVCSTLWTT